MARGSLPISSFNKPDGSVLANGYLRIQLSTDAQTSDGTQVGGQSSARVNLDSDGAIVGSPTFPTNATLTPSDTVYLVSAFTSSGQLVYENLSVRVV